MFLFIPRSHIITCNIMDSYKANIMNKKHLKHTINLCQWFPFLSHIYQLLKALMQEMLLSISHVFIFHLWPYILNTPLICVNGFLFLSHIYKLLKALMQEMLLSISHVFIFHLWPSLFERFCFISLFLRFSDFLCLRGVNRKLLQCNFSSLF